MLDNERESSTHSIEEGLLNQVSGEVFLRQLEELVSFQDLEEVFVNSLGEIRVGSSLSLTAETEGLLVNKDKEWDDFLAGPKDQHFSTATDP